MFDFFRITLGIQYSILFGYMQAGLSHFIILRYLLSALVSRWVHASSLEALRLLARTNRETRVDNK